MKQYFLKNGTRETGPYLLDDLKYQRIKPDTLVKEGDGDWQPISANRDLRFLLTLQEGAGDQSQSQTTQSQTAQQQTTQEKFMTLEELTRMADPTQRIKRTVRMALIMAIVFAMLGVGLSLYLTMSNLP